MAVLKRKYCQMARYRQLLLALTPLPLAIFLAYRTSPHIPRVAATAEIPLSFNRNNAIMDLHQLFGYHDYTGTLEKSLVPSDISNYFIPWGIWHTDRIDAALREDRRLGRLTIVTLEPWPWALMDRETWSEQNARDIQARLLNDIAEGRHDQPILASLRRLGADPEHLVIVRFMHEMEIQDQYPWWTSDSTLYINAYRHVVGLAREHGLENLLWMWSPAGADPSAQKYWPGDDVVDYVGLSVFATPSWSLNTFSPHESSSFGQLLEERLWVTRYGKPIILAEVGVCDNTRNRVQWLKDALRSLPQFIEIVGWVYFNQPQPNTRKLDIAPPNWSLTREEASGLAHLLASSNFAASNELQR